MDPQACFARITDAMAEGDYEEAFYACNDMIDWLAKGGFEPSISQSSGYHHYVSLAFFRNLRHALKRSQGGSSLA